MSAAFRWPIPRLGQEGKILEQDGYGQETQDCGNINMGMRIDLAVPA